MGKILATISESTIRIVQELSESAILCSYLMIVFSLISIIFIRGIVSGLFEMHRSRSAIKKIIRQYSFSPKMLLKHAWRDCLHAKRFCRCLIILHDIIWVLLISEFLLLFLSSIWSSLMPIVSWFTFAFVVGVFIPLFLLNLALERYPFRKFKHEFRFRKYHNTENHDSLW